MTLKSDKTFEERLTCGLQGSLLLTGPKFIIEVNVLQCLFVKDLIKNKGGIGLFQISQKERLFISYNNQVLLGVISQCAPSFFYHPKKPLPLTFILNKKRT